MEARSLGSLLASVARDSEQFHQPLKALNALVVGGETTVEVKGNGKGGRNQELVLSSVEGIEGLNGVAVAALGTDGVDGSSPAAGAIADPQTIVPREPTTSPCARLRGKKRFLQFLQKTKRQYPHGTNRNQRRRSLPPNPNKMTQ